MADKRSFEEQVRDQLKDFTVKPDAEVWENVGNALKEDKKRRWMIWMFFLTIAGSAATYGIYRLVDQRGESAVKNIGSEKNGKANGHIVIKKNNADEKKGSAGPQNLPEPLVAKQQALVENSKRSPVKLSVSLSNEKPVFIKTENSNRIINTLETNSDPVPVAEKAVAAQIVAEAMPRSSADTDTSSAKLLLNVEQGPVTPFVPKDAGNVSADTSSSPLTITDKKSTIAKSKKPWKLNAIIDFGESWHVSFDNSTKYLFAASPSNSAFNSSISTGSFSYSGTAAPAFAYRLGLEAQKAIGKKWDIGFLLAYESFTTQVMVGAKVDSLLSFQTPGSGGYYLANQDRFYTNHYHFLQAGISVYRQFNLGKKLAIRWQAGIEGNWLFSSNALYYNQSLRILYSDKDLVNKVQASISTAFEVGIGKAPFLYIGPGISYFLTPYSKPGTSYNVLHLWHPGLKMHIPLSKKRK